MINRLRITYCVFIFSILLLSCAKKKKREAIEGVYTGVERYIHIGPYGDTSTDESYMHQIELKFQDNGYFLLTKETYPVSYEIPSSKLLKYDSVKTTEGLVPRHIWRIELEGDSLYGSFEENNGWAGSYDHYKFEGVK
jgi:hypothetical protein